MIELQVFYIQSYPQFLWVTFGSESYGGDAITT